ncbi:MAG: MFS transporter [Actinomycetota bacterium]|nr:MFS transporter [Actinomycetota bacterium]
MDAPTKVVTPKDDAGIWITLRQTTVPVRAMLVGVLVNRLAGFLQTFLVLFMTHRGFSAVEAGGALSGYGIGALLGILLGGALADRLGPRLATLISMTGTAGLLLAVLYLTSFPAVLLAVTAAGLVAQLYRPAAATLLAELTPQHQQLMIFALYRLAINVGTTAAPILGVLLIAVSYNLLFWAEAIAALVYAAIAAVTLPRRPVANGVPETAGTRREGGYRALFRDRRYVLFLVAAFVNSVVYIQYVSTLPLTIRDAGLATAWYGAVVSLNGLIVVTCELLVTKFVQHYPMRQLVAVGFVLLGAGVAIYALPWRPAVFIIGTLVWTLAEMIAGPTVSAYPGLAAPEGMRGRYIGAMQTAFNLGAAVGPAVGVAVYHSIGGNVWWCAGLVCLVGLVLALEGIRQPAART